MSLQSASEFFVKLIPAIMPGLRRIAGRSRGETTVEDLQAEAWIVADELNRAKGAQPDLADKSFHAQILSRLYNRFVRFAEKQMRYAFRLDAEPESGDGEPGENGVMARMEAPEEFEPEVMLGQREDEDARERDLLNRFSEAVAYVRIFHRREQNRQILADHLAIAVCTLGRRIRRAERVVERQPSLFDGVTVIPANFMPPRATKRHRNAGIPGAEATKGRPCSVLQERIFPRAYIPIRIKLEH